MGKDFHKKIHRIESRCVLGPENVPFAGVSVHLSAQNVLQAGAVKGLGDGDYRQQCLHLVVQEDSWKFLSVSDYISPHDVFMEMV